MELVTRNYWWPEMIRDVEKYIEGCNICQRMKNRTELPVGKLKLSEVPEKLWTHPTVDFITKLLVVAGKDVILVVCKRLSKMMLSHAGGPRFDPRLNYFLKLLYCLVHAIAIIWTNYSQTSEY